MAFLITYFFKCNKKPSQNMCLICFNIAPFKKLHRSAQKRRNYYGICYLKKRERNLAGQAAGVEGLDLLLVGGRAEELLAPLLADHLAHNSQALRSGVLAEGDHNYKAWLHREQRNWSDGFSSH